MRPKLTIDMLPPIPAVFLAGDTLGHAFGYSFCIRNREVIYDYYGSEDPYDGTVDEEIHNFIDGELADITDAYRQSHHCRFAYMVLEIIAETLKVSW